MDNYQFIVRLGPLKVRNEKELQGLLRAVESRDLVVRSLAVIVTSPNGLEYQERLLGLPRLSLVENLSLQTDFSLGAQSLGVLAKSIEAGHILSLRHLNILYEGNIDDALKPASHRSSVSQSRTASSYSFFNSLSGSPGTRSSYSGSSQTIGSKRAVESLASWEGFSLLARALSKNLLLKLEKDVGLTSYWASRNLQDLGATHLAELIQTGYLSSMKVLDLENNSIGSDGIDALALALKQGNMSLLETLNLSGNSFMNSSPGGVMEIVRAMEGDYLPNLKWIGLSGAGHLTVANRGSIAEEIAAVFTRNTALTAHVEIDWPDKRLQGRWSLVLKRNLKLTRILGRPGRQEEVSVTNGKIFICGFSGGRRDHIV